jgi:hypothetical protein
MHGVTTALVGFVFAAIIWPHLVKNKVQFYAGFLTILAIILLDGVGHAFGGQKVIYSINALLQIAALVLLVISTGLSAKELGGEMFNTIEVVRRGGEKETIIVPLTGAKPKQKGEAAAARDIAAEEAALDAAEGGIPAAKVPPAAPIVKSPQREDGSIPLE